MCSLARGRSGSYGRASSKRGRALDIGINGIRKVRKWLWADAQSRLATRSCSNPSCLAREAAGRVNRAARRAGGCAALVDLLGACCCGQNKVNAALGRARSIRRERDHECGRQCRHHAENQANHPPLASAETRPAAQRLGTIERQDHGLRSLGALYATIGAVDGDKCG